MREPECKGIAPLGTTDHMRFGLWYQVRAASAER